MNTKKIQEDESISIGQQTRKKSKQEYKIPSS